MSDADKIFSQVRTEDEQLLWCSPQDRRYLLRKKINNSLWLALVIAALVYVMIGFVNPIIVLQAAEETGWLSLRTAGYGAGFLVLSLGILFSLRGLVDYLMTPQFHYLITDQRLIVMTAKGRDKSIYTGRPFTEMQVKHRKNLARIRMSSFYDEEHMHLCDLDAITDGQTAEALLHNFMRTKTEAEK